MKSSIKKLTKIVVLAGIITMGSSFSTLVAAADKPPKGDFARGAKAWADNCTRCHGVRDPKEMRDDQWKTTVFHMRVRAGLTGAETRDILEFLQKAN